jgi:predicted Zn-dependent peptidase
LDTISNGLRVVTVEMPNLRQAALSIYAKAGSRYETRENNGLSHFLEHMFFRGSARYPTSYELNDAIEQRGGTLQATTSRDYTCFYVRVHPSYLAEAAEVFAEMFTSPRFGQIDVERHIVLEEILDDYDEDGTDICVDDIGRSQMWPDHPLGYKIIGTRENILSFRVEDLREHQRRFYGASSLVFCAVGAVRRRDVLRAAEKWLRRIPEGPEVPTVAPLEHQDAPRVKLVDNDDAQTELFVSFRAFSERDPDYPVLQVIRRLLDDGISSRLQKHICEDLGLAYDIGAGTECFVDTGVLDIDVTIEKRKTERLVREILGQVELLRDNSVTPKELEKVKRRYAWDLEFSMDDPGALSGWFGGTELFYHPERVEEFAARVRKVTIDDVHRVAGRIFRPDRLVVAALGPVRSGLKRRIREAVGEF